MMSDPIFESGMTFGPYPKGDYFYIEKSEIYKKIQYGVKIAEFLLLRSLEQKSTVWIIEAKSSTPKSTNQPSFDDFIEEIREKFINTLTLSVAICLQRHLTCEELPHSFQMLDLKETGFKLILVIKEAQEEWLPPFQDALKKSLHSTIRTWNLSPTCVVVLNETMARSKGLIS
jgi:hypothetical protein